MPKGEKVNKTDPRIILACAKDAVIAFESRDIELKKVRYAEKDADKLKEAQKATFRNSRNLAKAKTRVDNLMGGGRKPTTNVEDYV